jgi:hypothetical protein
MSETSTPDIQFYHNLYPKLVVPEFDMNNYRINRTRHVRKVKIQRS